MSLLHLLEAFKKPGNLHYGLTVLYGEGVGADDSDTQPKDRRVLIQMVPVGYVGELRRMIVTTVGDLGKVDPRGLPKPVSNPPEPKEIERPGDYVWGTDRALRSYIERVGRGETRLP